VLAVVSPSSARAGTIQLLTGFQGAGTGYFFTKFLDSNGQPIPLAQDPLGSVAMAEGTADLGPTIAGAEFEAYCVDLLTPIFEFGLPKPPETYDAEAGLMADWTAEGGLTDADAGRRAAWLYTEYAADFADDATFERTALQMAIWNELYDGDQSVTQGDGKFYVNAADTQVTALANGYLAELRTAIDAGLVAGADAVWLKLSFEGENGTLNAQDFIGPLAPRNPATPVPEPGAGLLLGMGVMSLAAFRSRKTLFRRA
jgi:PEP-CTERM motif